MFKAKIQVRGYEFPTDVLHDELANTIMPALTAQIEAAGRRLAQAAVDSGKPGVLLEDVAKQMIIHEIAHFLTQDDLEEWFWELIHPAQLRRKYFRNFWYKAGK